MIHFEKKKYEYTWKQWGYLGHFDSNILIDS